MLKEVKSLKVWTDDYEAVEKAVGDVEVLYDFYREGDATEQETDGVDVRPDGTTVVSGAFYGAVDLGGGPATSQGLFDGFVAVFAP